MALIKSVRGLEPKMGNDCYLAENATVLGDVVMGDECSVWFNAVIRGDVNSIVMGNRVNVQDGAVIHCTYQKAATTIGNNVSIGHNALVHGCTVHDNVLIGMGSIVMDKAVVQKHVLLAAGSLVPEGKVLESGYLYVGRPAKKLRPLTDEEIAFFMVSANSYITLKNQYLNQSP
jgi:carbonic anhydrase/acetyltransferase-like protein (isoleucine patch superfamily)